METTAYQRNCQHCLHDSGLCNGEAIDIETGIAKEVYLRCAPITETVSVREQAKKYYDCLPRLLEEHGATMEGIVLERVFFRNLDADWREFESVRAAAYREAGIAADALPAISCLEQPPCNPQQTIEVQLQVVASEDESPLVHSFSATHYGATAKIVEAGGYRHLYLTNVHGCESTEVESPPFRQQSDLMFKRIAELLAAHGADFSAVLRTWCYLSDIDRDYDEFNASRNEFFRAQQVRRLPASTGIRAGLLPSGALVATNAYALLNPDGAEIEVMHTPTLNEAPEYGSSFSRGMRLSLPDKTTLFISGTASVGDEGETVHLDDIRRQIERTLVNVEELLKAQDATFADVVQVICYLKSKQNVDLFRDIWQQHGLGGLPISVVEAGVCRPDLLVELEAIAIVR